MGRSGPRRNGAPMTALERLTLATARCVAAALAQHGGSREADPLDALIRALEREIEDRPARAERDATNAAK